ncbi:MAG: hypothetical protein PHE89_00975 [Alphaproteobacteria bacterium]|nr:hypothetical protein [Alphaproteobacteria bacterium]
MTDKNKDTIARIKRDRIVKDVDGGKYAKVGGTERLASGEVAYVANENFQAIKGRFTKEDSKTISNGAEKTTSYLKERNKASKKIVPLKRSSKEIA